MANKSAEGLLGNSASEIKILEYITEPFTHLIVMVRDWGIDNQGLNGWNRYMYKYIRNPAVTDLNVPQ